MEEAKMDAEPKAKRRTKKTAKATSAGTAPKRRPKPKTGRDTEVNPAAPTDEAEQQSKRRVSVEPSPPRHPIDEINFEAEIQAFEYEEYLPPPGPPPGELFPDPTHITIFDSGAGPECVGFALAATIDYVRRVDGKASEANPFMLYEMAKLYDEWPGEDYEGTSAKGGVIALLYNGVCSLSEWPAGKSPKDMPADVFEAALENRPHDARRLRLRPGRARRDVQAAVVENSAVLVTLEAHDGWGQPVEGVIPFDRASSSTGGHAVAILGYTTDGFIIQNSFGKDWGGVAIDGNVVKGLGIWSYEDFETNVQDAWIIRYSELPAIRDSHMSPGFRSDGIDRDDSLNIMHDVRAIAAVLANRDVNPPLALGLFGDWGTGKSFFMNKLYHHIEKLEKRSLNAPDSAYCSNVVQIRFNAWHYMDTSLWASLAAEIFKNLFDKISDDNGTAARIEQELLVAQGLYREAELELNIAVGQHSEAASDLAKRQRERSAIELRVYSERIVEQLREAANKLGLTEVEHAEEAIEDAKKYAAEVWLPIKLLFKQKRVGKTGWAMLAIFVLVSVGIWVVPESFMTEIMKMHQRLLELATPAVTVIGWIGVNARRLWGPARALASAANDANKAYQKADQADKAALEESRQAVTQARKKVDEARERVETIQRKLKAEDPVRMMHDFIRERQQSDDYRKNLGLITLIRKDFEHLSQLMIESKNALRGDSKQQTGAQSDEADESGDPKAKHPDALPVQRIILYIDDLDRCEPKRVIEVLEAVHLLLAFRLFIVVVAVDPRWLRRCLEQHYPNLLSMYEREEVEGVSDGLLRRSTPQDYLEKIFQIPFYLRPIDDDGYRAFIIDLTKDDMVKDETPPKTDEFGTQDDEKSVEESKSSKQIRTRGAKNESRTGVESSTSSESARDKTDAPTRGVGDARPKKDEPETAEEPDVKDDQQDEIRPERIHFEKWEQVDMAEMARLFRTPRSVNRFVNTYRLLKATVPRRLQAVFDGDERNVGEYRAAMVLLAVVCGYPNVAPSFLDQLRRARRHDWHGFVGDCQDLEHLPALAPKKSGSKSKRASTSDEPALDQDTIRRRRAAFESYKTEWGELCDALDWVGRGNFMPEELSIYRRWLPYVARYSFSVTLDPYDEIEDTKRTAHALKRGTSSR